MAPFQGDIFRRGIIKFPWIYDIMVFICDCSSFYYDYAIFTTSQVEVCVAWVGPGGRTPVMLFSADIVQQLMGPLATPLSSQSSVVLSISITLVIQPLFVWSHPQTPLSSLEEGLGTRLLFVVQSIFFFTQMCISTTSSVAPFPVQLSLLLVRVALLVVLTMKPVVKDW